MINVKRVQQIVSTYLIVYIAVFIVQFFLWAQGNAIHYKMQLFFRISWTIISFPCFYIIPKQWCLVGFWWVFIANSIVFSAMLTYTIILLRSVLLNIKKTR